MSLIQTIESREGYVLVMCPECGKSIGQFSNQEVRDLSIANLLPLCFDCEPFAADIVPNHLVLPDDHYLIGIGSEIFLAEHTSDDMFWQPKSLKMHRISYNTFFDLKTGLGPLFWMGKAQ